MGVKTNLVALVLAAAMQITAPQEAYTQDKNSIISPTTKKIIKDIALFEGLTETIKLTNNNYTLKFSDIPLEEITEVNKNLTINTNKSKDTLIIPLKELTDTSNIFTKNIIMGKDTLILDSEKIRGIYEEILNLRRNLTIKQNPYTYLLLPNIDSTITIKQSFKETSQPTNETHTLRFSEILDKITQYDIKEKLKDTTTIATKKIIIGKDIINLDEELLRKIYSETITPEDTLKIEQDKYLYDIALNTKISLTIKQKVKEAITKDTIIFSDENYAYKLVTVKDSLVFVEKIHGGEIITKYEGYRLDKINKSQVSNLKIPTVSLNEKEHNEIKKIIESKNIEKTIRYLIREDELTHSDRLVKWRVTNYFDKKFETFGTKQKGNGAKLTEGSQKYALECIVATSYAIIKDEIKGVNTTNLRYVRSYLEDQLTVKLNITDEEQGVYHSKDVNEGDIILVIAKYKKRNAGTVGEIYDAKIAAEKMLFEYMNKYLGEKFKEYKGEYLLDITTITEENNQTNTNYNRKVAAIYKYVNNKQVTQKIIENVEDYNINWGLLNTNSNKLYYYK